jgi:ATP-dependent Clp protease, protease subunit
MPKKKPNKAEAERVMDEEAELQEIFMEAMGKPPELRTMMMFGEVDEEKTIDLIAGLIMLSDGSPSSSEELKPINFYISTYGGNADDMFALYDMMNVTKEKCVISTIGLGKVMSAGVLLLAAGTRGHRRIGQHCRIMIHSVAAGNMGNLHSLQNEMDAIKNLQDEYIDALVQNTNMSRKQIRKLLDRKVNVYLSPEEAVEYGIVDEII